MLNKLLKMFSSMVITFSTQELIIFLYFNYIFCSTTENWATPTTLDDVTNYYPYSDGTTMNLSFSHLHCSEAPQIVEANATHTATMIFLHDHGFWGGGYVDDVQEFRQPYMKVICPTADDMPIRFFGGIEFPSWFDFDNRYYPMDENDYRGLNKSAAYVHYLINEEIKHGIKPERIIVAGISQGALVALHAGISFPKRLGCIVALSLWNPERITLVDSLNPINKDIPVFHAHVTRDLYTKDGAAYNISQLLKSHLENVHYQLFRGSLETTEEEYQETKKFCLKHVGPI